MRRNFDPCDLQHTCFTCGKEDIFTCYTLHDNRIMLPNSSTNVHLCSNKCLRRFIITKRLEGFDP